MKILFAASECAPFVKTGGLADVIGSLPKNLAKKGADVRVILPLYKDVPQQFREEMKHLLFFYVNLGWRRQYCGIESLKLDGVTYYFVDNEFYFARDSVYGYGNDEGERYAFFCRAVLEALPLIGFMPDILHANDWQTGMIPALLKIQCGNIESYQHIKTVFTIHNLKYQGIFPWSLIDDMLGIGDAYLHNGALEYYGCINFLKGGIVFSDEVTTVSPTYAREVQMQWYGEQLDGLLRSRSDHFRGILNSIDDKAYNPQTDKIIAQNYSKSSLAGKAACKAALQDELGLEKRADVPLIAMVSRLTEQKGLDLIECVLEDLMRMDIQLVFLGKGEERYHEMLSWAQWRHQGRIAARVEVNEDLSRRFFAGSDIFLMPSRFEPCGLAQMIAMRYGAIPVVRETGGLKDTVEPYNKFTNEGTGFSFANYNAHEMLRVLENAVALYHDENVWLPLMRRAMAQDFGWDISARHYHKLYESLVPDRAIPAPDISPSANKAPASPGEPKAQSTRGSGAAETTDAIKQTAAAVAEKAKKTASSAKIAASNATEGAKKAASKAAGDTKNAATQAAKAVKKTAADIKKDGKAIGAEAAKTSKRVTKTVKKDLAAIADFVGDAAKKAADKLEE